MKAQTPDFSSERVLYVVATSHLDTQWRWTYEDTINAYIPRTLHENFALFEKYPNYTFSFEGAIRYMMVKEYYPEDFEKLKQYIADGRWAVCGSEIDAGDVNTVSPESLVRNILYGNGFFKDEFGVVSRDIFIPDCFGFGWALPSVMVHCGLQGFSTSKLEWGSSYGIPFNVGIWSGVDGSEVVATINPGQYSFPIKEEDLANDPKWISRIDTIGDQCGAKVEYKYFGLGDTGGAPDEESVQKLEKAIAADGAIRVVSAPADQLCKDLTDAQKAKLPRHDDEFLLIEHGVGTYTSHGELKRWNRKNEILADAAERANVFTDWIGATRYPVEMLRDAWVRFLQNQMHDILPGTCIPESYRLTWNDEIVSYNQFESALSQSFYAAGQLMDTTAKGQAVLVYNPLAFERSDVVEVTVGYDTNPPEFVLVFDPEGNPLPTQILSRTDDSITLLFVAKVPSCGFGSFDVRPVKASDGASTLSVNKSGMENERYRLSIDQHGDIASIFDKRLNRELLKKPIQMEFLPHSPKEWPAWTIEYKDITAPPIDYVSGPCEIKVLEEGPVRATLEITRKARGSVFTQRIYLEEGCDSVGVENLVTWSSKSTVLKARFDLNAANPKATYDLGLGTIDRGNNHNRLYEVPGQQWVDLTNESGDYGVSILTDCKYGWDKPNDHTLRLTLLHTPEMTGFECHLGGADYTDVFAEQSALDFGHHRFAYAISGHESDWRQGTQQQGERFNAPLIAAQVTMASGGLGRTVSMLNVNTPQVACRALKKAEKSDEYVIRLQELHGKEAKNVAVEFFAPVESIREVNGMEEHLGELDPQDGRLVVDMKPYRPRAFAVKLASAPQTAKKPEVFQLPVPFNIDAISTNANRMDGNLDGQGHSLPAEMLPEQVVFQGVPFKIGPTGYRELNAAVCRGQCIDFPADPYDFLYLLACSVNGDSRGVFEVDGVRYEFLVPDYAAPVGQWDDRIVNGVYTEDLAQMTPAFVKRAAVAWTSSHRHSRTSNSDEAYRRCCLYNLAFKLPKGARRLALPRNEQIRVFSATLVRGGCFTDERLDLTAWLL